MDWFLYDLLRKSMDWFLYDNGLRHERVNQIGVIVAKSLVKHTYFLVLLITVLKNVERF